MERVLGHPEQTLRTMTAMFAGQVAGGPVEIDVQVLRRGRSMSQLTATVHNPGAEAGLTAIAAFGAPAARVRVHRAGHARRARSRRTCAASATRCPRASSSSSTAPPMAVLGARSRVPAGDRARPVGAVRGRARRGGELVPARRPAASRADGRMDVAGAIVMCDTMPGPVGQKLGPRLRPLVRPERRLHAPRVPARAAPAGSSPTRRPATPATATPASSAPSGTPPATTAPSSSPTPPR